jgi:hypothetical protein
VERSSEITIGRNFEAFVALDENAEDNGENENEEEPSKAAPSCKF